MKVYDVFNFMLKHNSAHTVPSAHTLHVSLIQQVKQGETQRTFEAFWPIVLYHVSFFIFITTIGLNIIFGIIVDTFSELRDLKVR